MILAAMVLTVACNRPSRCERMLADIDSLTMTNADSARAMLKDMAATMQSAMAAEQAYYKLLCVKADDKARITHTTDSIIEQATEYYEHSDDKHHLAEAYYYAGRVNSDMLNGQKALIFYHKALLEDSTHVSPYLRSRIYAQLSFVYMRNGLTDDARNMQELACSYFQQIGDTAGMRKCEEGIKAIATHIDSTELNPLIVREKTIMVQKINEHIKNDLLRKKNQELQERGKRNRRIVVCATAAAILLLLGAWLIVRRRRKPQPEPMPMPDTTPVPAHRGFYDKEVNERIAACLDKGKALRQADWAFIEARLTEVFPAFKDSLYKHFNFSETEYRICLLIKLEVSPSNMAKLLATGASTISQSRLRMQQKVFNGNGTAKDWDTFVLSL